MATYYDTFMAGLPAGLRSFPACQVKASFFLRRLAASPVCIDRGPLDPELIAFLDSPPPPSLFVSAVKLFALDHALFDAFDDLEAAKRNVIENNRQTMASPLYRALFYFVSPSSMMDHAQARWRKVYQGIDLRSVRQSATEYRASITFPAGLVGPLYIELWPQMLATALEMTGAKNVRWREEASTATRCDFVFSWDSRSDV